MASVESAGFGIGVMSERSGTTPEVLRAWERRFGLELGSRTASGHRRYTEDDVRLVRQVVDARERGVTLPVAIAQATARRGSRGATSVHATLAARHPELRRLRLDHRDLGVLSVAIEDELLARGEPSVVWGGFQDARAFERSRPRWEELARTSRWCVVLADLSGRAPDQPTDVPSAAGRPVLVHLPEDSAMRREWCVVALTPAFAVVLSAWEVPSSDDTRVYETFLSSRRSVAESAGRAMTEMAGRAGVPTPPGAEALLDHVDLDVETSASDADRLWGRVIEALAR